MLEKAIVIAVNAHKGQTDKSGKPYIFHPFRVMLGCKEEKEQICAVLHDVLEDTSITKENLLQEGISKEIVCIIELLTRKKSEDYEDYISRILTNETACMVKLADLKDNMDLSRLPQITPKDRQRQEKYQKAKIRILQKLDRDKNTK